MTDHRDESLLDKLKGALGMGQDEPTEARHEEPLAADRTEGWAGVDEALAGEGDRPAGPDYGAGQVPVETEATGTWIDESATARMADPADAAPLDDAPLDAETDERARL